jgi:very-short-patch-repair endonuclease
MQNYKYKTIDIVYGFANFHIAITLAMMKTIKELCRDLRKNQTKAEKALWRLLRGRKLSGYKFLRQHPFVITSIQGHRKFYIGDFYCAEKKLVIEADGEIHLERKQYDQNRDEVLLSFRIKVLRFTNERILQQSESVINEMLSALESETPQ